MTEIRVAVRELVSLVTAIRPDWAETEAWAAVRAAKDAGHDWPLIARRLLDIALRDEPAETRPGDLWADVRGIRVPPGSGVPLRPELRALALRVTGPQPVLTEPGTLPGGNDEERK